MSRSQNRNVSEWELSKENVAPTKNGKDLKQSYETSGKSFENPQNPQLEKKKG